MEGFIFCSNCGKPVAIGKKFCTECGTPVPVEAVTAAPAAEAVAPAVEAAAAPVVDNIAPVAETTPAANNVDEDATVFANPTQSEPAAPVAETPAAPVVPEAPVAAVPEVPVAPAVPEVPVAAVPEVPVAPAVPEAPVAPTAPVAPAAAPEVPVTPVASAPVVPEAPAMTAAQQYEAAMGQKSVAPAPAVYTTKKASVSADEIPAEYRPINMWAYYGLGILIKLPVIGFIATFILAFAPKNKNIKNFVRSNFCEWIVSAILAIIFVVVIIVAGTSIITAIAEMTGNSDIINGANDLIEVFQDLFGV